MKNRFINRLLCSLTVVVCFMASTAMVRAHDLPTASQLEIQRFEVSSNLRLQSLLQYAMQREVQAVKVAVQRQHALKISHISWSPEQVVVIGHRLVRQQTGPHASMWLEEVRVTVPRDHLATNVDVNALQRELERLGIKLKPKPAAPRPTGQIAG